MRSILIFLVEFHRSRELIMTIFIVMALHADNLAKSGFVTQCITLRNTIPKSDKTTDVSDYLLPFKPGSHLS